LFRRKASHTPSGIGNNTVGTILITPILDLKKSPCALRIIGKGKLLKSQFLFQ
jgi:hypothetical protein